MADFPPARDSSDGAGEGPGVPRWVKVFGIIALVLVLLFVISLLAGVRHGPGLHTPSGDVGGHPWFYIGLENANSTGEPSAPSALARVVEVATLNTMNFESSRFKVSAGKTVTDAATNSGRVVGELSLENAALQQQSGVGMAHVADALGSRRASSVWLPLWERKQLSWRFGDSGMHEYAFFQELDHEQAGTRDPIAISVTPLPIEV